MGSEVLHKTSEKDRKMYRLKRYEYDNDDQVNSLNILSDKNIETKKEKKECLPPN